jgi:hypothetical protein
MTVDADLTLKILEKMQRDLSEVKGGMHEVKLELETATARLGAVEIRLGTVEQVLVTNVQEQRAATQYLKQLGHRVDHLEREP